jgi:hypothetical protein
MNILKIPPILKKEHIFSNNLPAFCNFPYILSCFWITQVKEYLPSLGLGVLAGMIR